MVYVREFDGKEYDFGVIGVEEGTLVMYDQQSRSWWSQLMGEAVKGPMKGRELSKLPSTMTTWGKWRALHPGTTVYVKRSIPYRARFTETSFAHLAKEDPQAPVAKTDWVVGVEGHVEARAYVARRLAHERVVHDVLEGQPIVVFLAADLATARVLDRQVGDRVLTFSLVAEDRLRDEQTGSTWDPLSGKAIEGPLAGSALEPLVSTYSLWFAWEKYRPDTQVAGEDAQVADE